MPSHEAPTALSSLFPPMDDLSSADLVGQKDHRTEIRDFRMASANHHLAINYDCLSRPD
ncbi:hypothetical protein PENSUB_3172 [Penicillium subrubescens]|uniref:Uncharacterized protein n=1 Tax=Penicillium subrubescens TaxID=1316194 RepID=A0A1Q5UFS9_9EURO|nr:hypothetical protein PENSUB_3172 [Penicillium subrubescens]